MKMWQKDYELDKEIEAFTVGNDYLLDQKLVKYDCVASMAHAKMLGKIKILSESETDELVKALAEIIKLNSMGKFAIKQEDEDCHTAIENYLVKKLGAVGKKIHTARSRNDQVATALRIYYKEDMKLVIKLVDELAKEIILFKNKHGHVEIPGYTHMQKATPSSIGLWSEYFMESMKDNKLLLTGVYKLVDQSPLGTGAGYGLPIKVDRKFTAKMLGFKSIQNSPLYVQNSRGKFESSILHAVSQIMFDLNKMASDIMMFSMKEFGYFELPPELCTGSSMMPHKKNPDVLELVRAKYHQIISCEFEVKSMIGNLVSGYNRDLQLTKEPVFNGFEVTKSSLSVMKLVLKRLKVNEENCRKAMTKELYATEKAYGLVKKGAAFRDAYKKISNGFG